MDDIDGIIVQSLRQLGCDIDEGLTLKSLDPATVFQCVSLCLRRIDPSLDIPLRLPAGMAQRYGVTMTLAEKCQELGCPDAVGYQTFLHSGNLTELRRVLMFLIDRLPKEDEPDIGTEVITATEQEKLVSQMREAFAASLKSNRKLQDIQDVKKGHVNFSSAELDRTKSIYLQTNPQNVWSTLITQNGLEGVEGFKARPRKSKSSPSVEVEDIEQEEAKETLVDPVEEKRALAEELRQKILAKRESKDSLEERIKILQDQVEARREKVNNLKMSKKVKERTLLVLENPEENLQKLEKMISNSKDKMVRLQEQWQEHRAPLQSQIDVINQRRAEQSSKTMVIEDQIEDARRKRHVIRSEMGSKAQIYSQLVDDLAKMNKNVDRNASVSRILEIIGNIRKQKLDIDKIQRDTREVQKDINVLTGKLGRQYTVTDDLLFSHAKKDEPTKRAYKLFQKAHADCAELAKSIQETGKISREIRDLEEQIENSKSRNTALSIQQISADLEELSTENLNLFDEIQRQRATRRL